MTFTPNRFRPASSPGAGMCVVCNSQPDSRFKFSIAAWAAGFVVELMPSAMSVSSRVRLSVLRPRMSRLSVPIEAVTAGESR